jgi:hypothetical protein
MAKKATAAAVGTARRWTEVEAREALRELAQTGESRFAFARRMGVSPQRVIYWQNKLGRDGRSTPAFVPVALPTCSPAHAEIEIRLGEIGLVVREGVDVEYVARLVTALSRTARSC